MKLPDNAYELFFELSLDLCVVADFEGYFRKVNPAWETTLGYRVDELLSRPYLDFIHPDDIAPTAEAARVQTEAGQDIILFENRYRCKDGAYRQLLWMSRPDPEHQLIYAVARDVTEQRETESIVREHMRRVERANAELRDFTHVVSHDLKEPLRIIEMFSSLLVDDYSDHLPSEGKQYLSALTDSSVRMRALIDDLLELSRIGRTEARHEVVGVGDILDQVRAELAVSLAEKGARLVVQDQLPEMACDSTRLRQLFENLIGNAIKYNDRDEGALVEVGHVMDGMVHRFWVRDNGNGIEPRHHEKIFGIFQRLVLRDQHEGNGVGLAICKKIVESHGGRIWVESEGEGHGSVFYFTVPVVPASVAATADAAQ